VEKVVDHQKDFVISKEAEQQTDVIEDERNSALEEEFS
jgi:hypothetical protein